MRDGTIRLIPIVGAAVILGGCATAGNEVLLFGTETKVGISISGDPAGSPDFTLGYRRREAVWLPVSVGGGGIPTHLCTEGNPHPPLQCTEAEAGKGSHVCVRVTKGGNAKAAGLELLCEEAAKVRRLLYVGSDGSGSSKDAYSVIANFGLQTGNAAGTEISQYIATGMAARILAGKGGEKLVRGGNVAPEIREEAKKMTSLEDKMIDEIFEDRLDQQGKVDSTKWKDLLTKANLASNSALLGLGGKDESEVRRSLHRVNRIHLEPIWKAAAGR